jgi:hypothetical protein
LSDIEDLEIDYGFIITDSEEADSQFLPSVSDEEMFYDESTEDFSDTGLEESNDQQSQEKVVDEVLVDEYETL